MSLTDTHSSFDSARESHLRPGGPFFDDLEVGQSVVSPGMTLTSGLAAAHQGILGDRSAIALDASLASKVTGTDAQLAYPGLVWDVAIGQSTHFSQRAKANLFYRGLVLHRFPTVGDTLVTRTEVVGLRQNTARAGRFPTGMVALRIETQDHQGRTVLDFTRCAMIPLSSSSATTEHAHDLTAIGGDLDRERLQELTARWDLSAHPIAPALHAGEVFTAASGDVVTSAPELARLTLNLAAVHHDHRAAGGRRLVYGGHTIGLAAAQLHKMFPHLVSIVAWNSCDHLGPVYEGDTVLSSVEVVEAESLGNGGRLVTLRVTVRTVDSDSDSDSSSPSDVLDWRITTVFAA